MLCIRDRVKATRPGMGSFFEVRLPANAPGAVDLAGRALDVIEELEAQLTVYRDDSEISHLNATAHLGPVALEASLFDLLQTAVRIAEATGGAYDVTAGALSVAWGFFRGPKRVPDPATLADARARTGSHHLSFDPERQTITFDRPGIIINLGSIGKGYALDRAAAIIRDHWWPTPALIHGGRSSLYALGSPPGQFAGRWEIALRNPFDPERPLGTIRLRNRGLGTSGAAFQQFEAGGRVYGHIIDPRTGEPPATGPASVTVLAPTATEADALSTAFYLLGPEATASYIESHPDVGAIFVLESAEGGTPVIRTLGLTDDDFEVNAD
ncbi:MAG: FAD:protein FMN transferase [Isosphaeraceae bacterium]|nr:FAD:protein FMN transferase [Isosphaeraceae bacterium]